MPRVASERVFAPLGNDNARYFYFAGPNPTDRVDLPAGLDSWPTGDQSVDSWRTTAHSRGENADPLEENGLFTQTSGSQAGFYAELRQRNKDDPGRFGNSGPGGAVYDTGHEFTTIKREIFYADENVSALRKHHPFGPDLYYTGPIRLYVPGSDVDHYPQIPAYTQNQINLDGSAFVRRTIPTNPVASLAQFVGELEQDIPKLPTMAGLVGSSKAVGLSKEYLNEQFGIAPFIGDLTKLASSVKTAGNLLRLLRNGSGLITRRKARIDDSVSVSQSEIALGSIKPYMPSCLGQTSQIDQFWDSSSTAGVCHVTETIRSQTWFSCAWTYFLDVADDLLSRLSYFEYKANYLLGSEITPETVWQLTPWTWLIDWFSSVGNVIHNAERLSSDSLVMRYGYIMHQTDASIEYRLLGLRGYEGIYPGSYFPTSISKTYSITSKERHRASPYGFGVDMEALSPSRAAILGALGLTRAPRILRNNP
jgi:hypothetical protein